MRLSARIKRLFRRRKTSDDVLNELRAGGAQIGRDVLLHSPNHSLIDKTCPFLVTIGDHVRFAAGAIVLTHDFSWSVLKRLEMPEQGKGAILGAQSPVVIGSHVFIGMNAIITRGVKIGDYVIIGAGSVVTKDCEPHSVYAGNPAKRLCSIEEYYQKRKERQFDEARQIALLYRERFGKEPPREIFREYFMLFSEREEAAGNPEFRFQMELLESYEATVSYMDRHAPMFADYRAFLDACYTDDAR